MATVRYCPDCLTDWVDGECPDCGGDEWAIRDTKWNRADLIDRWDIEFCPDGIEHDVEDDGMTGECVRCGVGVIVNLTLAEAFKRAVGFYNQ